MVFKKLLAGKPFLKSGLLVISIKTFGLFISFITLVLAARFFDKKLVGQYNYINSLLFILGALAVAGTQEAILKYAGILEAENKFYLIKKIYKKKLFIVGCSSGIIWLLFFSIRFIFSNLFQDSVLEATLIKAIVTLPFFSISLLNFKAIRGLRKLVASEVFFNLLRHILLFISVLITWIILDPEFLLYAFMIVFFLLAVSSTYYIFSILKTIPIASTEDTNEDINRFSYKEILRTSYPMTISYLSLLIMKSLDIIILEQYTNFENVALYGIVVRVSVLLGIVLMSVNAMVAPDIAKFYHAKQFSKLKVLVNKSVKMTVYLTIPILVVIFGAPTFVLGLFGEPYKLAKMPLLLITFGELVNICCGAVGIYMNMTGKQLVYQRILLIALALNILLNLILIPKFGMVGAAFSTSFCLILWNLISVIYVYKKDRILFFIKIV